MMESPHDYDDYGPRCDSILPFFGAIPLPPPSLAWGLLQTSTTSPWDPPLPRAGRRPELATLREMEVSTMEKWFCRWFFYGL